MRLAQRTRITLPAAVIGSESINAMRRGYAERNYV